MAPPQVLVIVHAGGIAAVVANQALQLFAQFRGSRPHTLQLCDDLLDLAGPQIFGHLMNPAVGLLRSFPVIRSGKVPGMLQGMPKIQNFAAVDKHRGAVPNPLGSITLNLDLIQKEIARLAKGGHSPEEGSGLVAEMREEVRRIQRVLEEYLQFARLPKPQLRPVQLNEFLAQKLDFMNGTFERAGVKRQTHFDPAVKTISADAGQLWQAALNLIRNSLDAMPEGGELTVGTWGEGGQVRLRVTDTGKGMSEEQLKKVFAPFFTTKPGGTGLGLAMVQQIAAEHGGHLECESTQGKGSAFTIFLPVDKKG